MSLNIRQPDYLFRDGASRYPARHKSAVVMIAFFIGILGVGYILFHSSTIFAVPDLYVTEPADGALVRADKVMIAGETDPKSRVEVNGYEVFSDDNGDFRVELPLQRGIHILDIRVKNRIGKEAKVVRHIIVE
ncbi:MAG: hypothetical protein EXS68_01195 [Candidatus Ryanbacteria bacterium]|nr:hypothetical protein [Candidatus Ryanbacteria bacterium]